MVVNGSEVQFVYRARYCCGAGETSPAKFTVFSEGGIASTVLLSDGEEPVRAAGILRTRAVGALILVEEIERPRQGRRILFRPRFDPALPVEVVGETGIRGGCFELLETGGREQASFVACLDKGLQEFFRTTEGWETSVISAGGAISIAGDPSDSGSTLLTVLTVRELILFSRSGESWNRLVSAPVSGGHKVAMAADDGGGFAIAIGGGTGGVTVFRFQSDRLEQLWDAPTEPVSGVGIVSDNNEQFVAACVSSEKWPYGRLRLFHAGEDRVVREPPSPGACLEGLQLGLVDDRFHLTTSEGQDHPTSSGGTLFVLIYGTSDTWEGPWNFRVIDAQPKSPGWVPP
jgi:hypothetical protein